MAEIIRKANPAQVIEKDAVTGGYPFVISSENPDLVGDVVVQRGLSPVSERIPAQIDHSGRVNDLIGYWSDFKVVGNKTVALLNLFEKGLSQTADFVRALLDTKIQMAASIGFRGDGELRDPKKGYAGGLLYKSATLLETSVVVVPCHQEALSIAKSLNLSRDIIDAVLEAPSLPGQASEAKAKAMLAIRKANRAIAY